MEKIKISKVLDVKTGNKDGRDWTITKFVTSDGRTLESFGKLEEGGEYEGTVEVATNPTWTDKFKIPRKGGGFGGAKINYRFEARKSALESAVKLQAAGILKGSQDFVSTRDKFEEYLLQTLK